MQAAESPRPSDLPLKPTARKRRRRRAVLPTPTLEDLGQLPLEKIGAHLTPRTFTACEVVLEHALLPPCAVASAMQHALMRCDSLPPRILTASWDAPAWLQCAQMAAKTADQPSEVEAYEDYIARGAPSQHKFLRLQSEATLGWRCQGYIISEELDAQRARAATLQSLDLSALLFPPFPRFDRASRDLPLEHVRFSTGYDARQPIHTEIRLTSFFQHTPALRWLEVTPKKNSSPMLGYDADFPLQDFCLELADALDSSYAAHLSDLRLDFSRVGSPVRQAVSQRLLDAIAKRAVLHKVSITWPG